MGSQPSRIVCADECTHHDWEPECLLLANHSARAEADQSVDSVLKETSCFKLETKNKIFLSHAGAQKCFVEQLCLNLERTGYFYPFFDKRGDSLPEGENFPELILDAARQCHVAVIVLSEEYMSSKWPMIELAEFHKAQNAANEKGDKPLHMLPLFFKLSVADLDESSIQSRWMPKWEEHASKDEKERIQVDEWSAATRALSAVNGLKFEEFGNSEVRYRKAVEVAIWRLTPPDFNFGTRESVVGWNRLCKFLLSQFTRHPKRQTMFLGLGRVPGTVMTTMCQSLCDYLRSHYEGRVCYLEMGSASPVLERLKHVMKRLWRFDDDLLSRIMDPEEVWMFMDHVSKQEKVLLVLDNVLEGDSSNEARRYLNINYHPESRIAIFSRSRDIVEELLHDPRFAFTNLDDGPFYYNISQPLPSEKYTPRRNKKMSEQIRYCIRQCISYLQHIFCRKH